MTMAWSAPMTAVSSAIFEAAQFNQFVRDNLLETGPAKATVTNRLIVTNGANAVREQDVSLQPWTPTFTNFTLGTGAIGAGYRIVAGVCVWRIKIVFAADTSISGTLAISTPVNASGGEGNIIGGGVARDISTIGNRKVVSARMASSTTFEVWWSGGVVGATTPFAWAVNDELAVSGDFLTSSVEWV